MYRMCNVTSYEVQEQFLNDARTGWVHRVTGGVGDMWGTDREGAIEMFCILIQYSHR